MQDLENAKAHVPQSFVLAEQDWPKNSGLYQMSFVMEQQLASGISFIAAHKAKATAVTACAVQELHGSLLIRVAANDGLDSEVATTLHNAVHAMQQCASKSE